MGNTSSISSSAPAFAGNQVSNLNQVQGASSSVFGNLLRQTEVAMGLKSKTGFSAGATYEAKTLAGQTKATVNSAINATKSLFHIK
ncbi:MAG: hypothetical protein WAN01_07195 [Bradyrhizobium sp.]|jgi:hypothetical protein